MQFSSQKRQSWVSLRTEKGGLQGEMYRIRYTVLLDGEEYPPPSCSSKFPFKGKPGVL